MKKLSRLLLYNWCFNTLAIAMCLSNLSYGQSYSISSKGANYGNGGAYNAPTVTKQYIMPSYNAPKSVSSFGTSQSGSSTSSYSGSSSSYSYGSSAVYRSKWQQKYDKYNKKELALTKAKEVAAKEWKTNADKVILNYNAGKFFEAEKIRRSFPNYAPDGVGDIIKYENPDPNGYDPSMYLGKPFQDEYENRFQFICLLLMGELKEYNEIIEYYQNHFVEIKYDRNYRPISYTYNHQEQTPALVKKFQNFTYPEILQLESVYIEALKQKSGKIAARKYWTAVSNYYVPYIKGKVTDLKEKSRCYNNIAMVQLQLGLTEDAVKYFDKQLSLTPNDYLVRFTVLQNIVDYTNTSLQNDTAAIAYCLKGLNYLLTLAPVKTDKELTYTINFDKVILLMGLKNYQEACSVLKSSGTTAQQNNFTYWLLESRLYLEIDSIDSFLSLTQKMAHNLENITPLQSAEFGTLLAEWGMKYANQYARAENEYNQAIALFPSDWTYSLRLAQIYEHQNKDNEAIELLENLIIDNPDEFPLYLQLGDQYVKKGKTKKAKEQYFLALAKGAILSNEAAAITNPK